MALRTCPIGISESPNTEVLMIKNAHLVLDGKVVSKKYNQSVALGCGRINKGSYVYGGQIHK